MGVANGHFTVMLVVRILRRENHQAHWPDIFPSLTIDTYEKELLI